MSRLRGRSGDSMKGRLDNLTDDVALVIVRFLAAFIACAYLRIGFVIADYCDAGQGFWCESWMVFSPFVFLLDFFQTPNPALNRILVEVSLCAVVVAAIWTIKVRAIRRYVARLGYSTREWATTSARFLLGVYGRLCVSFAAALGIYTLVGVADACGETCTPRFLLAPAIFAAPPDPAGTRLLDALPMIWAGAAIMTVVWTAIVMHRLWQIERDSWLIGGPDNLGGA
jgi:hypothetical protein